VNPNILNCNRAAEGRPFFMEATMLKSLLTRFSEPSSWAGIAVLATAAGVHLDAGTIKYITYVGAGAAGIAAFLLPEGK
jgi:hypothetical protein